MQQQQPSALEVLHSWDAVKQCLVFCHHCLKVPCHKIGVTKWSPKDFDDLSISGQQRSPPHSGVGVDSLSGPFQTIAHNGPGSCTIPQLCLAHVDSDACILPQRHLKEVVDRARPVRWRQRKCHPRTQGVLLVSSDGPPPREHSVGRGNNNGIIASPCSPPSP